MNEFIPVPDHITQQISRRAVDIARIIGPRKTGKGLAGLSPTWENGVIGISVSDDAKYMLDLDRGIEAHPMRGLANKTIPVRSPGGNLYFRKASAKSIGEVPIVTRSSSTGKISSGKPEWVYPAKQGLNFLQRSLEISVEEWTKTAKTKNIIDMMMQTSIRNDVSMFIYGREII